MYQELRTFQNVRQGRGNAFSTFSARNPLKSITNQGYSKKKVTVSRHTVKKKAALLIRCTINAVTENPAVML